MLTVSYWLADKLIKLIKTSIDTDLMSRPQHLAELTEHRLICIEDFIVELDLDTCNVVFELEYINSVLNLLLGGGQLHYVVLDGGS